MAGEGTCEAPHSPKRAQLAAPLARVCVVAHGATVGGVNVCVYCASNVGDDPAFADGAAAVGRAIVQRGAGLVYGGGNVGLMGIVADEVLAGGGNVTGIITEHLMKPEVAHPGLDALVVVADMPERKRAMFERSDAFVTLPGGVGTMEEMFEVLCWSYLGLHPKPMGLLNLAGFYDHLLAFLDQAIDHGLCKPRVRELLVVGTDVDDLFDRLL